MSKKISLLEPSATLSLNAKAKALQLAGHDVLNFSVGEPDYPALKGVVDHCIDALQKGQTRYGPAGGGPVLRQAISTKLLKENQLEYAPEQIVCGIGAKEILFHTFLSLINEGDEVILLAPYWVSYRDQVLAAGGKPVIVPMAEDYKNNSLNFSGLEAALSPKTKIVVVNSPNNPAGFVYSKEQIRQLGDILRDLNVWIISDEIYEYLAFDKPHYSFLNINPELYNRTILVNGLSKSFAMTGFRVGYGAGPKQVIELVKRLQEHSSSCLPPFIEHAAVYAVGQGAAAMQTDIAGLKERKNLIQSLLKEKLPQLNYIPAEGAFYVFIDLRNALKSSNSLNPSTSNEFCRFLLEKHLMAAVPGEVFGVDGFIRLSYATKPETITKGIDRLAQAIKEINHGKLH
ncbi:MAG: pyridoxal phosphate-dependent aminotransferase [Oligoflexales bacterium]|nr:pyridoxal phosphate-dependent aminotransferase [Oligoflexales bacterium]